MSIEGTITPSIATPEAAAAAIVATANAEPAKTEAPATETKTETPIKEQIKEMNSTKFAALARREKMLFARQKAIKEKEENIAKQLAELDSWKSTKAQAKMNPIKALESLGLSYEDITNYYLNGEKITPEIQVKAVKEELDAFKRMQEEEKLKSLEEEKARIEEERKESYEAFRAELDNFISSNKTEYELINLNEANDLVLSVIEENFQKTQKIMNSKEACGLVEKFLEDRVIKNHETAKIKSRIFPQNNADGKTEPKQATTVSPTLSNKITSTATTGHLPAKSEAERMARAIAALEGIKK